MYTYTVYLKITNSYAMFCTLRYEAHLQTGQLTLWTVAQHSASINPDEFDSSSETVWALSDIYDSVDGIRCAGGDGTAVIIHLSDGNVRVETSCTTDTFTLINDKNDFL